jgi:hypothetical protein
MPAEKHSLVRAVEDLKRAVNAPTRGRGNDWTRRMDQAILAVEQAVQRHDASLSDDKGCVVDVDSSLNPSPGVARKADGLHQTLDDLLREIQSLRRALPSVHPAPADMDSSTAAGALEVAPEVGDLADFGVFCEHIKEALDGFDRFSEKEAVLMQESVTLDLGAGD